MTITVVSETGILEARDRLVVAPAHGKLISAAATSFTTEGEVVRSGDVVAQIDADGTTIDIPAPCDAWVMNYLLRIGQRVEPGSAIVHLRAL